MARPYGGSTAPVAIGTSYRDRPKSIGAVGLEVHDRPGQRVSTSQADGRGQTYPVGVLHNRPVACELDRCGQPRGSAPTGRRVAGRRGL